MSYLGPNKSSRDQWKQFRTEMYSLQGPLHNYKDFAEGRRGLKCFRTHIVGFITELNKSCLAKTSKGIPVLANENDGRELFNEMQSEEARIERLTEEIRQKKAESAAERAEMRVINDGQGLVPPTPAATTRPTAIANFHQVSAATPQTAATNMAASLLQVTPPTIATIAASAQNVHPLPATAPTTTMQAPPPSSNNPHSTFLHISQ